MPLPPVTGALGSTRPATPPETNPASPPTTTRSRARARLATTLAFLLAISAWAVPATLSAPTAAAACGSLQSMVNATPAGGTLNVPNCVYHESVTINKAMTLKAAAGATVDGDDTRATGVMVTANNVTIDGLTVQRVRSDIHVGAVNLYYGSNFTFRNGVIRDSSTVCIALHAATGAKVLDSELARCGKEGYFLNGMSNTTFARNNIHHNNPALAFDWGTEAGGGKTMDSNNVTFDGNVVAFNRGPGIWFDGHATNATIINNRIHHNDREGVFFEISSGARIANNAVWNNGFGFAEWGYGAGILVSSSDNATVSGNTVAWNARGISVISQNRDYSPHNGNTVADNVVVSAGSAPLAGFYDDHGGSLWVASNGNTGHGNRYWAGNPEPTSERFMWNGWRSTLGSYNGTNGEEGGSYLSVPDRDTLLGAAGIPNEQGTVLPKPGVAAGDPRVGVAGTALPATGLYATLSWHRVAIAKSWQVQLQRVGGHWVTAPRTSARVATVQLLNGRAYRARLRLHLSSSWSPWATTSAFNPIRLEETSAAITWSGAWTRPTSAGASGSHIRSTTAKGASAKVAFTGRAIAWAAPVGPTRGAARIYVDGVYKGSVTLAHPSSGARRIVYRTSWTSSGSHTLQIVVVGTQGHPRVDVDAFAIIR